MPALHRAIELAVAAHAGQDDPPGEPYILHPMRVMLSLPDADHDVRCVGILHDAVERGTLTLKALRHEKFADAIIRAVELMTHDKKKESYAEYVVKLKPNRLARAVKIADLMDNANLKYVDVNPKKGAKGKQRVARYALSYEFLNDRMSKRDYRKLMKDVESD